MTVVSLVAAVGLGLLDLARPGSSYLTGVLPGVVLFSLGLGITAAPLTSAVLASASEDRIGGSIGHQQRDLPNKRVSLPWRCCRWLPGSTYR
jgi:hypothetical protein